MLGLGLVSPGRNQLSYRNQFGRQELGAVDAEVAVDLGAGDTSTASDLADGQPEGAQLGESGQRGFIQAKSAVTVQFRLCPSQRREHHGATTVEFRRELAGRGSFGASGNRMGC